MTINVLDFLEKSAEVFPEKTAVIVENKSITYQELMEASKIVGSELSSMTNPGSPVGIYMEKGIDALCSMFGAAYAGGFYTVLNTELPGHRLEQIQSVLNVKVIITSSDLVDDAKEIFGDVVICSIEEIRKGSINGDRLCAIRERVIDTDPLYINFTSGSTGVPKGIAVCHRSVIDFINCFTDIFSINEEDIIANQAPFDFDVSVKDIYSAIKVGATLVIVPRVLFSEPVKLIDYLCDNKVTTMTWAVSALCLISTFHGLEYRTPTTVNKILFSGEVMPYKHLNEWMKHLPDATFVNLYGPTEITCNCTYHILESNRDYSQGLPIGKPFPNEDVFLLDEDDRKITKEGVTGRIMVRGTALALGYYHLPEKNSTQFIQNPLNKAYPEVVYNTGDLGVYNEDGELQFCGRVDNQIKYLGHRIELEEIERGMAAIEGVERCICYFDEKKSRLKGFYVGEIEKTDLHATMRDVMPAYMIPGYIRKIETMPLTKNGKIDRKQIAEMNKG